MAASEDQLVTRMVPAGESTWQGAMRRAGDTLDRISARWGALGELGHGAAARISAGFRTAAAAAGQIEQAQIGFTSALGSQAAAQAKIAELAEFAARTPFDFGEATRGAQMLLGMGASAEQVIPIMESLGNAVSASGRGQEAYNRAILATSQIISKGRLTGEELRQLAEAGVPLKDLMNELGVAQHNVADAGIDSERAISALIKTMSAGRFAGAMEAQSRTLTGAFSNLRDAGFQLAASFGEPLIGPLTAGARVLSSLATSLRELPAPVRAVALVFGGVFVAAVGAANLAMRATQVHTMLLLNAQLRGAGAANAYAAAQGRVAVATAAAGRAAVANTAGMGWLAAAGVPSVAKGAAGFRAAMAGTATAGPALGEFAGVAGGAGAGAGMLGIGALAAAVGGAVQVGMGTLARQLQEHGAMGAAAASALFPHMGLPGFAAFMMGRGGAAAAAGGGGPAAAPAETDAQKQIRLLEEQNGLLRDLVKTRRAEVRNVGGGLNAPLAEGELMGWLAQGMGRG